MIISEIEKREIKKLYGISESNSVIIKDWVSPDEKYFILFDEMYDATKKISLGNIWENLDILKSFLTHSFQVSNISESLKEKNINRLNNILLTESRESILLTKSMVMKHLNEGLWDDFTDWAKETGENTVKGITDFVNTTDEGGKKMISAISSGDMSELLSIMGKGMVYFGRRLRDALYSPVGIVIDTFLIFSGFGKAFQWIPWAIVVALDIYEITTGDVEEGKDSTGFMQLFFDCLGLVFSGGVAKAMKLLGKPANIIKNSRMVNILKSSLDKLKFIPDKLGEAAKLLSNKFPTMGNFISGIITKSKTFIERLIDFIKKILQPIDTSGLTKSQQMSKGLKGAAVAGGIEAGIGTYSKGKEKDLLQFDDKEEESKYIEKYF